MLPNPSRHTVKAAAPDVFTASRAATDTRMRNLTRLMGVRGLINQPFEQPASWWHAPEQTRPGIPPCETGSRRSIGRSNNSCGGKAQFADTVILRNRCIRHCAEGMPRGTCARVAMDDASGSALPPARSQALHQSSASRRKPARPTPHVRRTRRIFGRYASRSASSRARSASPEWIRSRIAPAIQGSLLGPSFFGFV